MRLPPRAPAMRPVRRVLGHEQERFLARPPTIRNAALAVVTVTTTVVIVAAVVMRVLDAREFPTIWLALWWAVQTATTVGYGDVTPKDTTGRVVAGFAMLGGIGFLAIVTASVTSVFITRAERELGTTDARWDAMEAMFEDVSARLERIEQALPAPPEDHPHSTMPGAPPGD